MAYRETMNICNYIKENKIKPADAIVIKRNIGGILNHYLIFIGWRNTNPVFIANFETGVKEINNSVIQKYSKKYSPSKIDRFKGNFFERQQAVNRALSKLGEKSYSLIKNNCEHFKNWVHFGIETSDQVKKAGVYSLVFGTSIALGAISTKNRKLGILAILILLLALFLFSFYEKQPYADSR